VNRGPASSLALPLAVVATTVTLLALDVVWLGVVAKGFYDRSLGSLKRPDAFWPAALLFYAMYITAVVAHAVRGAETRATAARRGAAIGLIAYGTYDLTNWAVIAGWPAVLVPVDIGWGVVLTSLAALAGHVVLRSLAPRAPR
jgi:uncharacterized membrane protein